MFGKNHLQETSTGLVGWPGFSEALHTTVSYRLD